MGELWDLLDENGNKIGKLHERGTPLAKEYYFLVVAVWICNNQGEFLISRRAEDKNHLWHTTGGCATAGDDSITAALREVKEEIGIDLNPNKAEFFKRTIRKREDDGLYFQDVWLFREDVDIAMVVLQPEEICDVMWASVEDIRRMIAEGSFVNPQEWYPQLDEFFKFCK